MRYLITLFLSLAVLITAGCGFRLQGTTQVPEELKTLRLSSGDPYGPLARAIRQQLRLNNVNLIDKNLQNVPILKIVGSSENTKTVSIYQDGKSAEKQLNFWVSAQIILPNGAVYPIKTRVERTFFDNPLETLAKDAENELVKQEMREQAARQLIRKLLIVHSSIQNEPAQSVAVEKARAENSE
ncbi:LPS assembly lipoprotein LptE [Arsenophonus nasoniae]|uniref:LPS-assembly lipoprotein LptE n=1 Tax=Arsenophonus nasoniae TaxID=638 RepID=A0A4P7KR15_9GAMM|nr:LPS assembly lipoprotein LptE [Arsenophonus nasoniae]QBY42487.1 LPS-assembly lipoprotein LptE [Arsenophonus nasoniae]WGM02471.1 LPS assembly lipoprotein LptE [Arsenophonus nasoniae]WGM06600.1 LPS assembly lipoprotein LptE [Arsenophonus nasoniae]WGM11538.1 LPS assembly lipoprotein LptE [Arsenophonus nasoniae]WGM16236.1 LPS assembly lipoprotein LptE [Arsenophonus nasoniae]